MRALPWLVRRFRVLAVVRHPARAAAVRALGAKAILADLDQPRSLARLTGLAHWVLHFAPPPGEGDDDPRTRALVAALSRRSILPQRWAYISTTGVYGDHGGALIDECARCRPDQARSRRRLAAEAHLRRFGGTGGRRVSILRAPGIYAADRLPVERLVRGDPVLCEDDDVYTSHIHADDLARAACMALFRGRPNRVYNVVDGSQLKMGAWFEAVAQALALAAPPRIPRSEAAARLSPAVLSFMQASRRLDNRRLSRELRLRLRYPDIRAGLAALATPSSSLSLRES